MNVVSWRSEVGSRRSDLRLPTNILLTKGNPISYLSHAGVESGRGRAFRGPGYEDWSTDWEQDKLSFWKMKRLCDGLALTMHILYCFTDQLQMWAPKLVINRNRQSFVENSSKTLQNQLLSLVDTKGWLFELPSTLVRHFGSHFEWIFADCGRHTARRVLIFTAKEEKILTNTLVLAVFHEMPYQPRILHLKNREM